MRDTLHKNAQIRVSLVKFLEALLQSSPPRVAGNFDGDGDGLLTLGDDWLFGNQDADIVHGGLGNDVHRNVSVKPVCKGDLQIPSTFRMSVRLSSDGPNAVRTSQSRELQVVSGRVQCDSNKSWSDIRIS